MEKEKNAFDGFLSAVIWALREALVKFMGGARIAVIAERLGGHQFVYDPENLLRDELTDNANFLDPQSVEYASRSIFRLVAERSAVEPCQLTWFVQTPANVDATMVLDVWLSSVSDVIPKFRLLSFVQMVAAATKQIKMKNR